MQTFSAVTIDPPGARDLDDAVLVRRADAGWTLQVVFPDLSARDVDGDGRARIFTRYRREGPQHMLAAPELNAATLAPGRARPAVLVSLSLDADAGVTDVHVQRASFESLGQLTYAEATRGATDPDAPFHADLKAAAALARKLADRRASNGALAIYDVARGLATDEEGGLVELSRDGHVGEMIIREAMIATNAALAGWCAERGVQILYRNHRARPTADRDALRDDLALVGAGQLQFATVAARVAMVLERANVGPTVQGHWALNLPAYAWFTSPLRRYTDIVNQRILLAALDNAPAPYPPAELAAIAAEINDAYDRARTETSAFLKSGSNAQAVRTIERGGVGQVDQTGFTAVLKASHEKGMTTAVAEETLRRFQRDGLSSKDILRAMMSDRGLADRMAAHMATKPFVATSVIHHGVQALGWLNFSATSSGTGPDHAPWFEAEASITVGSETYRASSSARTAKEAQQRATFLVLVDVVGAARPDLPVEERPNAAQPAAKPKKPPLDDGNARGRLQELCQANGWRLPTFIARQSGPSHAPSFVAIAVVATDDEERRSEPQSGASKKEAERRASADLLAQIEAGLELAGGPSRR